MIPGRWMESGALSWAISETLNEIFFREAELESACSRALEYVLDVVDRPGGALLVQRTTESQPALVAYHNLDSPLKGRITEPSGELKDLIHALLNGGKSNPAIAVSLGLAGAIPLRTSNAGVEGVLLLQGTALDEGVRSLVEMLAQPLARGIYLRRAQAKDLTMLGDLFSSRNTLRALFDNIPAALYIIDREYKLIAVNASRAQRSGQRPQKLVGRKCYNALYRRGSHCRNCMVLETLQTGEPTQRMAADAKSEWEITTHAIRDENDEIVQAILLEQDITEKLRMEAILAQAEKLAAVGELAAGVAHEINNPLTAIIANAQMLRRDLPPDHDLQESVDLIARAGERATQVVRNLLDFARKEQYPLAPTDVNETIRRSLGLIGHKVETKGIAVRFHPGENLPMLKASQNHLLGVWLNLLLNAIDAIEEENGLISINTLLDGDDLLVVVRDTGKGVQANDIHRIFEPFYTTKAPGSGTGLGLSVCDRIVKQHGGSIEVESSVGEGTTFTVRLPVT